jgi:hypothetical protein
MENLLKLLSLFRNRGDIAGLITGSALNALSLINFIFIRAKMDCSLGTIIKTMVTAYACGADHIRDFLLLFFRGKNRTGSVKYEGRCNGCGTHNHEFPSG